MDIAITIGTWLWKKYGDAIADKAVGKALEEWRRFNWNKASDAYRAKVLDLYGTVQIFGMVSPFAIEDIYTDLFVYDQPSSFRFVESTRREDLLDETDRKRASADRILRENQRIFLLGRPGSGKTTFLQHIVKLAAEEKLAGIPIYISLKQLSESSQNIDDEVILSILTEFEICGFPNPRDFVERILKNGDAIVLFDGLDEVPERGEKRQRIIKSLMEFFREYNQVKTIVTCRSGTEYQFFRDFRYVELSEFRVSQVRYFVGKWFRNEPFTATQFLEQITTPQHHGLLEMGSVPLLLALMCLAFEETKSFPKRRSDLYRVALNALLEKWDKTRGIKRDEIYRDLSTKNKNLMFSQIAFESFDKEKEIFSQSELESYIERSLALIIPGIENDNVDAGSILTSIETQHGIFVERATQIFSFHHRSFHEFYAANYIALEPDDDLLSYVVQYVNDRSWSEVFLLASELLSDQDFERFFTNSLDEASNYLNRSATASEFVRWAVLHIEPKTEETYRSMVENYATAVKSIEWTRAINIDIEDARLQGLTSSFDFARSVEYSSIHSLSIVNAIAITLALDYARTLSHSLFSVIDSLNVDYEFEIAESINTQLFHLLRFSSITNFGELHRLIQNRPLPSGREIEWQRFHKSLDRLIDKYEERGFVWSFGWSDLKALLDYMTVGKLLLDCLKVAQSSRREELERTLLML